MTNKPALIKYLVISAGLKEKTEQKKKKINEERKRTH